MKKVFMLALAALLLAASPLVNAQTAPPTKASFSWGNPNSAVPSCSTTVTTNCLVGWTITDLTAETTVSSTIAPTATTYIYVPTAGTLVFGWDHNFTLVLNALDANGKAVSTAPVTATAVDSFLLSPTGFSGATTP